MLPLLPRAARQPPVPPESLFGRVSVDRPDQLAQNVLLVSYLAALPAVGCNPHGPSILGWWHQRHDLRHGSRHVHLRDHGVPGVAACSLERTPGTPQTYASLVPGTGHPGLTTPDLASIATLSPAKVRLSSSMGLVATQSYNPGATGFTT